MNLLIKLEELINKFIILLQEQAIKLLTKFTPTPVKTFWAKINVFWVFALTQIKNLPALIKKLIVGLISRAKQNLFTFEYKEKLIGTYNVAMEKYKSNKSQQNLGRFKKIFLTPFLMLGQWLQGLSVAQSLVLLTFSALSVVSMIGMVFSGQRLAHHHLSAERSPASTNEDDIVYDRPEYYKKQTRFFELTSLRLPVYFPKVNEIRSVDVDFNATMSNRNCKQLLEKLEFQLRDHLILQMEPVVASFPLEEEGKEMIRQKLLMEINDFLLQHQIEGTVEDLEVTYILAN